MGHIVDLGFPHILPPSNGGTRRGFVARQTAIRDTHPSIVGDTPMVTRAAAEAVWEEAHQLLGEELPQEWIDLLAEKAETIYAHSTRFRRRLRGANCSGRDWLWAFMRHWLADLVLKQEPAWYARLPVRYAVGCLSKA